MTCFFHLQPVSKKSKKNIPFAKDSQGFANFVIHYNAGCFFFGPRRNQKADTTIGLWFF